MARSNARLFRQLVLISSVWLAIVDRSDADPYYTVTDVGRIVNDYDVNNQSVTIPQSGVSYPFVVTTTPTSTVDTQNLPGVNGIQGAAFPRQEFFPMTVLATNSLGTVLGGVPDGSSRAEPYSSLVYGYAVPTTNGQYSGFIPLSSSNGYYTPYLSQANEILYKTFYAPLSLINVNTGISTPVDQLVPPALLQQFGGFFGVGIDDRGDILVVAIAATATTMQQEMLLLTPPGLAAPVAAPEPSTLLIFGLISVGMGLRTAMPRRRA